MGHRGYTILRDRYGEGRERGNKGKERREEEKGREKKGEEEPALPLTIVPAPQYLSDCIVAGLLHY